MSTDFTSMPPTTDAHASVPLADGNNANQPVIELSERVEFNMHDAYYEHATRIIFGSSGDLKCWSGYWKITIWVNAFWRLAAAMV